MKEEYPRYTIDMGMGIIQKVRKDFAFIADRYFAILVFGSHAKGYTVPRSDIDVCIVTKDELNAAPIFYNEIYPNVRMDVYDVMAFEGCNDELKSEIARNHITVYCNDEEELERYLEPYKRLEFKMRTLREIAGELRSVIDEI
jgi:predicted nucleotidyltransferase